ncbi:hypothetical protein DFH08DRAFT_797147 [Mycena albidolilacea]|uniref:Uncharacterized protein n=1 Tax=Mycena albidolilacea TaxID=1033008 RepID=A0AAD7AQK7_9AGAR|nr:hypothetical protein DFH08DRAFT_797147 [Mycena albidolilacea]
MCQTSFQLSVTLVTIVREAPTQIHFNIKKGILWLASRSKRSLPPLHRQVYIEDSGPRFWDSLDADLCKIRNHSGGNPHKLNNDIVDEVQCEVDDTISAAAADRAATIPTTGDMGDVDED